MKRDHEDENLGHSVIKKPILIMGALAALGYFIYFISKNSVFLGFGNIMVMVLILYVFNHFILTPKLIIPFQENLLPRLKKSYQNLISWIITGWRPLWVTLSTFGLLVF
jgi:predicted RND superfamily exporter protein